MPVVAEPPLRLAGCQLRLPTFEGPLDVLLRLIERNQLAITDVSLVAVTDQFLAYMASLADAPPELLAEFTAVAARLLALKSRSLLPAPPAPETEEADADLAEQLIAYQAV
ncbi:MAG: segregation/condensation protein A, partial [Thermomicrobiaceae bacterium]|nr:segregation/condensation protein A [Thermomicrobiaceae bacterium]